MNRITTLMALTLTAAGLAACGGGGGQGSGNEAETAGGRLPESAELRAQLQAATRPAVTDFPAADGRTLQQVANGLTGTGTNVGLATSVFRPGRQRLAFGVIDDKTGFVYGKTAVYLATGPREPAQGPFLAPADLLITDPAYRSKQAASEGDLFAAVYSAQVELKRPGKHSVLVVTALDDGQTVGAGTQIEVVSAAQDQVPDVGEMAPRTTTETLESAGGDMSAIETRQPPDTMHDVALGDVLGKKPVALLFATPQLCESRVCGPVVDIGEQLKATYADRITFIHQEVFEDNVPTNPLRKPLADFRLQTEPWLFVLDRQGRVAARLEGSFGFDAFKGALEAGLR